MSVPVNPTWSNYVSTLFSEPYWIDSLQRASVGAGWIQTMIPYGVNLSSYSSVRSYAVTIYYHLASRSMPLTSDPTQYWPGPALDAFKLWVNQGMRQTDSDPIVPSKTIPDYIQPLDVPLKLRRDILSLSEAELNNYRAHLDDALNPCKSVDVNTLWQQVGLIHSDWCLHYQEAFLLWHRTHLAYYESLINYPIPYWNFFAADSATYGHPSSGLPKAFLDETYVHPVTGLTLPNPLKYARAKAGLSVNGVSPYPARDPLLVDPNAGTPEQRQAKINMTSLYLEQIKDALAFPQFSTPQGVVGYPWANIPRFNPPPPDSDYPYRGVNFDGLYEQPHDSYHGWIGPDMADNAYTAFDPIFWSYHANIDRIFEKWRAAHPGATFTAQFPLKPFVGHSTDIKVDMNEPRAYINTTIGDVARDPKALGYTYAPPVYPDYSTETSSTASPASHVVPSAPLGAPPDAHKRDKVPYVVFDKIKCTMESFTIDVFLTAHHKETEARLAEITQAVTALTPKNSDYVGRITRLGMGTSKNSERCIKGRGITQVLNGTRCAQALGLKEGMKVMLIQVVKRLSDGTVVGEHEWKRWDGFTGELVWGQAMGSTIA